MGFGAGDGGDREGDRAAPSDALDAVLLAHRRWVESEGREGASAVLRGMSFDGVDLSGAMLRGADLSEGRFRRAVLAGADLSGADLSNSDFHGANLSLSDLRGARLRDANFRDASLVSADLSECTGLLGGQLGGADLGGAILPESAGKFEGLVNVAEASKTTQNLFASLLLVCSYIWLTIASTTDSQLLNNAAPPSSRLPILGTDIPLVRFYLVAPLLVLCLYVYFHLCLQRLWEELAELPAVFPDGRPLDRKAYPWLLNVIARTNIPRLRHNRSQLTRWQARMSILLAWGLVPLTMVILWGRYVRGHDWLVTGGHVLLIAAAIGTATGFLHLASTTLQGSEKRPFLWRKAWADARMRSVGAGLAGLLGFAFLSYGAIEGVNPGVLDRGISILGHAGPFSPRRFVPQLFSTFGYSPFAHLDDASLSIKPANWSSQIDQDLEGVKGADLTQRNLRYASVYNAFLINAYMMDVDARGTDFRESDLRKADFRRATLREANFRAANLEGADLRWTDLSASNLREAKLRGAKLAEAKLNEAQLRDARAAGAIFTGADLRGANLSGADLAGADLCGADLGGVVGLTQEQVELAVTDASTILPRGLTTPTRVARRR